MNAGTLQAAPRGLAKGRPQRRRPVARPLVVVPWCGGPRRSTHGNSNGAQPHWGNVNRLSPERVPPPTVHRSSRGPPPVEPEAPSLRQRLDQLRGRLLYSYFCWRQDTWSDLQLFLVLNTLLVFAAAAVYGWLVREHDPGALPPPGGLLGWWSDMYQGVLAVVLGQDLPPAGSAFLAQAFAASISVLGVTSFAMVLALTEQWVLEVLERNVRQGSDVYESGHVVVLAWCTSEHELSQLQRILTQLCQARRAGAAPGVAVVLTEHREKLEMEGIFRESIPQEERAGMQIVFRQGSPLNPAALRMVAATSAKAVILSGDYSRPPIEADAQCLRTAVLLDEMCVEEHGPDGWAAGRGPAVVAQVKTDDGLDMVHGSCSDRIIPVPTTQVNVRRLSRLLRHPIASMFARMLTDYSSAAHGCLVDAPQLVGRRFDELHAFFCRSLVVGIASSGSSVGELNPPPSRVVQPGDRLVMLRPGELSFDPPMAKPMPAEPTRPWDASAYVLENQDVSPLAVTTPHDYFGSQAGWQDGPRCGCGEAARGEAGRGRALESVDPFRRSGFAMRPAYLPPVPVQFQAAPVAEAEHLLICGWGLENKMWALLQELDHGINPMPAGSRITLVNDHIMTRQYLEAGCRCRKIARVHVTHKRADPRNRDYLGLAVDVSSCRAAIVLCDTKWGAGVAREFSTDLGLSQRWEA